MNEKVNSSYYIELFNYYCNPTKSIFNKIINKKIKTTADSEIVKVFLQKVDITYKLKNDDALLSKSESVKFSLIESVIYLFTDSSVKKIFLTAKSVHFH